MRSQNIRQDFTQAYLLHSKNKNETNKQSTKKDTPSSQIWGDATDEVAVESFKSVWTSHHHVVLCPETYLYNVIYAIE